MARWSTAVCLIAAGVLAGASARARPPQQATVPHLASSAPTACPYRPGEPYTADVHIGVTDAATPPDSADVHLTGAVPGDGRQDGAGRYVAALPVQPVSLRAAALKHFAVAPHLVVTNPGSPDCTLDVQVMISGRSPAFAPLSHFTFTTTVRLEGRTQTLTTTSLVSCFDQDTPVRLASGQTTPVKNVVVGDRVWNPLTHRNVAVREVIQGTQAGETLYRIGDGANAVLFTAGHPLMTRRGEALASRIALGDEVLGDDGRYHAVTVAAPTPGDPTRLVYNLVLATPRSAPRDHWMSVGGLVAGDYTLQRSARR